MAAPQPGVRSDSGSGSRKTHPAQTESRPDGSKAGLSLKKLAARAPGSGIVEAQRGGARLPPPATAGHRREPCATAGVSWTQPRVPTSLWPRASVQTRALCSGGWGDSGRALAWAERGLAVGQETEEERGGTRVAEVTAAGVISTCVCAPLGGGHPPQVAKAAAALPTSITPTASIWPSAGGSLLVAT